MSIFSRIDAWLGLRVFHPPAIALCWLLRCTQHRLNRDMWFLYTVWGAWAVAHKPGSSWWHIGLMLAISVLAGLIAAFTRQHIPASNMGWFRFLMLAMLPFDLIAAVVGGHWQVLASRIWVLIGEYAATITDLPPPPIVKVRKAAKVRA